MLLYYIEDPSRQGKFFAKYSSVNEQIAQSVRIFHSLPQKVDPEISTPVTWFVQCEIPIKASRALRRCDGQV